MPAGNVSFNSLSGGGYNPNRNTLFFQTDKNKNDDSLGCGMLNFLSEWECIFKYSNNGNPSRIDYSDNLFGQWAAEYQNVRFVGLTKTLTAGYYLYILPCETIETGSVLYGHAKIVVNGNTLFDGDVEWRGSRYGDPNFAYQIKEGDEIQIFWETLPEPVVETTATIVVNATYEQVGAYAVADFYNSDGDSLIQVFGNGNAEPGMDDIEPDFEDGENRILILSQTLNFFCANNAYLSIAQTRHGNPALHPALVKVTINGNVFYSGQYNPEAAMNFDYFSYVPKPGDLIVIDWIRIDETTQEPVVIDNPNKNTLWVQTRVHGGSEGSLTYSTDYSDGLTTLLSCKRNNVEIIPLEYSDVHNSRQENLVSKFAIQAGDILTLFPEDQYLTDAYDSSGMYVARESRVKVTVNGTVLFEGTIPVPDDTHMYDTDSTVFGYTVNDGDEITVFFETDPVKPKSSETTLVYMRDVTVTEINDYSEKNGDGAEINAKLFEWRIAPKNELIANSTDGVYLIPKGTTLYVESNENHTAVLVSYDGLPNQSAYLEDDILVSVYGNTMQITHD